MLLILYLLLMIKVGGSTEEQIFETKTAGFGQDVTLSCARNTSWVSTQLYWIRIVSKNWPEVLGATFSFDQEGVNRNHRISAKQEPGAFTLHISQTQPSDTGLYNCIKVDRLNITILTGTFLRIKESDITVISQVPSTHLVHPGDSVTLQCLIVSDSEKKTCPGENSVFWFRAGSDESHPSLIYAHGNSADGCERRPEAQSPQICLHSFSKNISSSDNGTYYCAVATCGEILFGEGTKVDIEVSAMNIWDLQRTNTVLLVFCAALAFSLIVFAFWTCIIKKKFFTCFNAASSQQKDFGGQKSQQKHKDMWVYSAVVFTMIKTDVDAIKTAETERIYAAVRALGLDY